MTACHSSIRPALTQLPEHTNRVFLIGGAQLYNLALTCSPPMVDRVLLTRVLTDFECDTFLNDFTKGSGWTQTSHQDLREWVGWDVPEGDLEEKGTKYRFEMWKWREKA